MRARWSQSQPDCKLHTASVKVEFPPEENNIFHLVESSRSPHSWRAAACGSIFASHRTTVDHKFSRSSCRFVSCLRPPPHHSLKSQIRSTTRVVCARPMKGSTKNGQNEKRKWTRNWGKDVELCVGVEGQRRTRWCEEIKTQLWKKGYNSYKFKATSDDRLWRQRGKLKYFRETSRLWRGQHDTLSLKALSLSRWWKCEKVLILLFVFTFDIFLPCNFLFHIWLRLARIACNMELVFFSMFFCLFSSLYFFLFKRCCSRLWWWKWRFFLNSLNVCCSGIA